MYVILTPKFTKFFVNLRIEFVENSMGVSLTDAQFSLDSELGVGLRGSSNLY